MDVPATAAGTVHTVCTPDNLIVLIPISVKFLPLPGFWRD